MAAGDIEHYGPYNVDDDTSIIAGLAGVLVADDITAYSAGPENQQVFFVVIKAA